jgi:hypothetical protein
MINLDKEEVRELIHCIHKHAESRRSLSEIDYLTKLKGKLLSVLSTLNCDRTVDIVKLVPSKE